MCYYSTVERMRKISFASLGDLCIDTYEKYNRSFPGGTAFNTAVSAVKAGANASVFSAIGIDASARIFQKAFRVYNIDSSNVKILQGESSSIRVHSSDHGQRAFSEWRLGVLRAYTLQPADKNKLREHDIAKMTLFKPLQELFDGFCQIHMPSTMKAADFAGSSAYSEGIFVIQQYIHALDVVVKSVDDQNTNSLSFLRQLSVDNRGKIILVLRGKKGSMTFLNGILCEQPAIKTTVKDTNGAGDAYIAHFLISYLRKRDIPNAMVEASKAASEKISKLGAT